MIFKTHLHIRDGDFQRRKWRSFDRNSKKYTGEKNKFSIKAKGLALPLRPLARLAQDEEPGRAGSEAGGRRGLGSGPMALKSLKLN
jgi:hypothetical protein